MWGHLCIELVNLYNFNVSFSTHKSEVLIHLSQWQYWWWFWFSFFWTFYFFMILRSIKHRVFKMSIRLNTSFRSRGKWGDYLVTLIPLSWCLNILLNSNFILRMIEWQSESGSLIIRIHGKQWYWVYKYDLGNVMSLLNTPKNIGKDKWVSFVKDGKSVFDLYNQTTQLKIRTSAQQDYWGEVNAKDFNLTSNFKTAQPNNIVYAGITTAKNKTNLDFSYQTTDSWVSLPRNYPLNTNKAVPGTFINQNDLDPETSNSTQSVFNGKPLCNITLIDVVNLSKVVTYNHPHSNPIKTNLYFYENNSVDDDWEVYSNIKVSETTKPIRIYPQTLNTAFRDSKDLNIINIRFLDTNNTVVEKPEENIDFVVIKQKRYKRKQNINNYWVSTKSLTEPSEVVKKNNTAKPTGRFLQSNMIFQQITQTGTSSSFDFYSSMKLNRARSEVFSVNLSRRLLRTTRTLVLPAFTNISIIANSYDVVHSWFIPGLGLKIDCVPGKSTHHSLYIDNVGLYYGQCAEICGRYHHHMPIRICALPFEHFLVWWTNKGLPKSLRMRYNTKKIEEVLYLKYRW